MSRSDPPRAAPDAVYIHWPFCAQKCPYCDFNSHVRYSGWDEQRFRAAYLRELDHTAERLAASARSPFPSPLAGEGRGEGASDKRPRGGIASIFFGGGTPSLMQPETVAAILKRIDALWGLAPDCEITLEANPNSVEAARFAAYRSAGVNRVSIGVQSLHDEQLRRLGRIHSVAEAKRAIEIANATFERVSFDLIYARPGQTLDQWRAELGEALSLAAGHLSLYQLTIEPDTPYAALHAKGKLVIPDEDHASALYDLTGEMCSGAGLPPYEISNYARPGEESRHNLVYWRYGTYAGIGPGAHGRLAMNSARLATRTERHPETWASLVEANGHGVVEEEALDRAQQTDEALLMGLRLTEGVPLSRLADLGGVTPSRAAIEELAALGLLAEPRPGHIAATPKGRFVLNELVLRLSRGFVGVQGELLGHAAPNPTM